MPNLDRIAKEGTSFTNAFANGPWTLPSHASMFTGQYTSNHGAHAGTKSFDPQTTPIAGRLSDASYHTAAFSNNTWVSKDFGYDRGFDDFYVSWDLFEDGADLASIAKKHNELPNRARALLPELLSKKGPKTVVNALYAQYLRKRYDDGAWVTNFRIKRWLSNRWNQEQPFFMFVNFLEPHLKYDPPRQFRKRFLPSGITTEDIKSVNQDAWAYLTGEAEMTEADFQILDGLYKAELNYLDHRIGKLYDHLEQTGLLEDTTIIITGDHGENIGDHELMDHQYSLHDTLTHVPVVIRDGDTFEGHGEVDDLIELRDLYPTILELAGIEQNEMMEDDACSLVATLEQEEARDAVFSEYITPQPSMETLESQYGRLPVNVTKYDRGLRSVRTQRWKLIQGTDGSERLYDVANGDETTDVIENHPETAAELREKLQSKFGEMSSASSQSNEQMDTDTKQRLEDLGYL